LPALYRILLSELKRLLIGLTAKVPVTDTTTERDRAA
jgi:hypothetical protein